MKLKQQTNFNLASYLDILQSRGNNSFSIKMLQIFKLSVMCLLKIGQRRKLKKTWLKCLKTRKNCIFGQQHGSVNSAAGKIHYFLYIQKILITKIWNLMKLPKQMAFNKPIRLDILFARSQTFKLIFRFFSVTKSCYKLILFLDYIVTCWSSNLFFVMMYV